MLNILNNMAYKLECLKKIKCISATSGCFNLFNFPPFCIKPLQAKCLFANLLNANDLIAFLPTASRKSLSFQLRQNVLTTEAKKGVQRQTCFLCSAPNLPVDFSTGGGA